MNVYFDEDITPPAGYIKLGHVDNWKITKTHENGKIDVIGDWYDQDGRCLCTDHTWPYIEQNANYVGEPEKEYRLGVPAP